MALRDMRIKLKLRIHAALDRYGLQAADLIGQLRPRAYQAAPHAVQ